MPRRFARGRLESLEPAHRRAELEALARQLTARLAGVPEWDDYWREVQRIIEELRALDHDLWSHDYDGERRALWGWDYMRLDTAGYLQLEFDHRGSVRAGWRSP